MAELQLDRVEFCTIETHKHCFRAIFEGTSVDPVQEWHLQWEPTGRGIWQIMLPSQRVHDVPVAEKYEEWPPIALLDVDRSDVGVDLRPAVAYIGNHLWLSGGPSPFPMPSTS